MDNLEQLWCHSVQINEKEYGKAVACAISEEIACFITDTNFLHVYDQDKLDNIDLTTTFTEDDKLCYVQFLAMHNAIFVASNYRLAVVMRDLQNHVTQSIPSNIVQLAWNPTETLLVIISENEDIILYSYTPDYMFEIKSTVKLNVDVPSSLYVGWGSHNTQFLGPKGRQYKEKDVVKQISIEYEPPTISWRRNGEQFVVNYYDDGQRFIKVFNKDLIPLNKCEKYINLLAPVCMVLGQCIACCATKNDINTIVIFEKNCKVKSSFEVPENKGKIKLIRCHPDMNLLAIYSLEEDERGYINIYLLTNGIWKLKQQLYFSSNRKVCGFDWLLIHESLYTLCRLVVFTSKNIEFHTFRFVINRCPNTAIAAVVSGRNIDFYDFADKIIPPPLSLCSIEHIRPINRVLFHPQKLLCVLLDCKYQAVVIDVKHFQKLLISNELDVINMSCFHSIAWNENNVISIYIYGDCHDQRVIKTETSAVTIQIKMMENGSRGFMLPYSDTTCLTSYKCYDDICKLLYLTKKVIQVNNSEIELDFALSSDREFYVNDKMVCRGITSCFVFQNYLVMTSADCRLHCIRIQQDYEILYSKLDLKKIYSREIEQGARIVVNNNSRPPKIILQLPRGNLESIGCRLITVDVVENLLRENRWKAAVELMRTERLNWNLLVDLNPERFSEHIEDFVKAAKYCSLLSNIVNDFSSSDVAYKNCLPDFAKLNCDKTKVIRKILEFLISANSIKNFTTIVSIQHKHISLKSALKSIKLVFEEDSMGNKALCKSVLHSILIKEDIKNVLKVAYSLYNLDFVLFVYQNSTIDPKHYEPVVERLKQLSPVGLRYEMALSAQDLRNAVKYILRYSDFPTDKLETFIVKHKLEEVAYNTLQPDSKRFELVTVLYAKKLSRQQIYTEAGLILKRIGLLPEALEEYKKALDWVEILELLTLLEYDESHKKEVLYDLSSQLVKAHRIDEAVLILEHYNNDYRKAVEVLVDHKEFRKAIALTKMYKAVDLLDQMVVPNLNVYMLDLLDKIDEHKKMFMNYVDRLQMVRHEKKLKLEHGGLGIGDWDDDLFSDSGSVTSGSSRSTSQSRGSTFSSKNRRKEERKKIDLREGGYYEDIALIRAIHILYGTIFAVGKEVREVCLILEHKNVKFCRNLHKKLSELHDDMIKRIPDVWCDVFVNVPELSDNTVLAIVQNKADLDPEYSVPPSKDTLNLEWKLKIFS